MPATLWLIRHGETAWSVSGAHTGRTDIALTERGEVMASRLGAELAQRRFAVVLTSPLRRALDTCRLCGYSAVAKIEPGLREWDYGAYEGRTTADIRRERPGWDLWSDGVPDGESLDQVAARASSVIDRALETDGDMALFGHGHLLRILAAAWLELPPVEGRRLALDTASVSVLGWERERHVMRGWNRQVDQ